jgi:hypothetical protein
MNLMNQSPVRILGPIRTGHVYVTMAEIGTTPAQVTRPVTVPECGAGPLTGPGAVRRPMGARAAVRQAVARPTRHMPRGAASLDYRRTKLHRRAGHRKGDAPAEELIRLPQLAPRGAEFGGRAARSSGTYRARLAHARGRRRALPGHGRAVDVRGHHAAQPVPWPSPESHADRPRRTGRTATRVPSCARRVDRRLCLSQSFPFTPPGRPLPSAGAPAELGSPRRT